MANRTSALARKRTEPALSPLALRLARLRYADIKSIESYVVQNEGHAYTGADLENIASRIEALPEGIPGILNVVEAYEQIAEEDRVLKAFRQYRKQIGGAR